ncbi:sigma factor [Pseudoclavibacter helvolus]|uniref:sigma factor n=1 Tax=Pseudoclavibacter helvolus TaxID=255205 RepID=UPI0024AC9467|nr:sigma factor [Pseudoclavibacter helvolus]
MQETFLRAWRARDSFDPAKGAERIWLFAIARNVIADALRARERLPRVSASGPPTGAGEPAAETPDPPPGSDSPKPSPDCQTNSAKRSSPST